VARLQTTDLLLSEPISALALPVLNDAYHEQTSAFNIRSIGTMICRKANFADLERITSLLQEEDLRPEGVLEPSTHYWVAEEADKLLSSVGLELGAKSALLRSAIVEPQSRGQGIGRQLATEALDWAKKEGFRAAYCLSTHAGSYWLRLGFRVCPVDEVGAELKDAPQMGLFHELGWLPTEVAFKMHLSDHTAGLSQPN